MSSFCVEIWGVDHYVLAVDQSELTRWTSQGYVLADESRVMFAVDAAVARARYDDLVALWTALFGPGLPADDSLFSLQEELREAAMRPGARLQVLKRELPRGFTGEPFRLKEPAGPPRLDSEHYIVVQAVDPEEEPVARVQLELLIADGEVKGALTGDDGFARFERICAGNVVIRVLSVDGALWTPLDGAGSNLSGSDDRVRWHSVEQGECLSRIAHRHGLSTWQELWDHPKNLGLRKKRKSPHVLLPGDQVAVPGVRVHEIVRSTDATHRIEVSRGGQRKVRLRLQDLDAEPFAGLAYDYRYVLAGRSVEKPGSAPTDADGFLEEILPIEVDEIVVALRKPRRSFSLRIGALDPARDADTDAPVPSGVSMRLAALGYALGPTSSISTPRAWAALCAFQADVLGRAAPDGELDRGTLDALERVYGA